MLLRLAVAAVIGYLVLVVLLFLMQRRMLYLPDQSAPADAFLPEQRLEYWPQSGNGYRALIGENPPQSPRGTVIVFHGNAGAARHRDYYVDALRPLGFRVLLAEYPGYGGRRGRIEQHTLVADGRETVRRVAAQFGDPVYLWGESLGCGVIAAIVADDGIPAAGIVLITPWDSLGALAQTHYPYAPARWLIRDRYDSIKNLSDYRRPVAVIAARTDQIIPREHTMRLFDSLDTAKRLWTLPGGHNSWPTAPESEWWREVSDFIVRGHDGARALSRPPEDIP